jgi:hypothetical protein
VDHYALYAEYFDAQHAHPIPAASSSGGATQTPKPAAGTRIATSGPAESIRLANDPAAGAAGQSSAS